MSFSFETASSLRLIVLTRSSEPLIASLFRTTLLCGIVLINYFLSVYRRRRRTLREIQARFQARVRVFGRPCVDILKGTEKFTAFARRYKVSNDHDVNLTYLLDDVDLNLIPSYSLLDALAAETDQCHDMFSFSLVSS